MRTLRTLLFSRRRLALTLVALVLCMKALVPAGFMLSDPAHSLTVTICTGTAQTSTQQIALPAKDGERGDGTGHGKGDTQCSWASHSHAATGGGYAPLLAAALAFILALGFLPAPALPLQRTPFLRPPLRGPPATA